MRKCRSNVGCGVCQGCQNEQKKSKRLTVQDEFTEFLLYTAPGGGESRGYFK